MEYYGWGARRSASAVLLRFRWDCGGIGWLGCDLLGGYICLGYVKGADDYD